MHSSASLSGSPTSDSLLGSVQSLGVWLESPRPPGLKSMIGRSPAYCRVIKQAEKFAQSSAPVLITGESGTGKEGLSRFVHQASNRIEMPYVCVNCAALSESLLESELFGHEQGAFTGALARRQGRFELANGGTLLLDEVSEIPVNLQAKLLRVLEESEFQRVGGNETHKIDVRIIATSNRLLAKEVQEGRFRQDLYYRINVLRLDLPPLKERPEDIPQLAQHFVNMYASGEKEPPSLTAAALDLLRDHAWPGNVRQLRNVIHRACVLAEGDEILPMHFDHLDDHLDSGGDDSSQLFSMQLEDAERILVLAAIEKCRGNKTEAAKRLGVTSRTLQNKMRRYRELGYAP